MNIEQQLFLAIAYRATSVSAIARAMGIPRQYLHSKITRNTLTREELCEIGKILGGKYVSYFSFPGGVTIGDKTKGRRSKAGADKSRAS